MSDIEFETDKAIREIDGNNAPINETPRMVRLVMKLGIKDTTTASYILVGIAVVFIGFAVYMYAGIFKEPQKDWSLDAKAALDAQKYQR